MQFGGQSLNSILSASVLTKEYSSKTTLLFSQKVHIALQKSSEMKKHQGVAIRSGISTFTNRDRINHS